VVTSYPLFPHLLLLFFEALLTFAVGSSARKAQVHLPHLNLMAQVDLVVDSLEVVQAVTSVSLHLSVMPLFDDHFSCDDN
jgi:hypothetical protein